ncbi:hypothetical protein TrLO_g7298 [Triparma laevis f. longispina]|uniref:Uncharacterized protein n=1 Tax=Triparma laevis f. longispina TaxID=1714387 RepID=A0A9W6ZEC0_9STRA|nr:hypothetical protein TrLO_g7298 [Triparma laevis f. longispina]
MLLHSSQRLDVYHSKLFTDLLLSKGELNESETKEVIFMYLNSLHLKEDVLGLYNSLKGEGNLGYLNGRSRNLVLVNLLGRRGEGGREEFEEVYEGMKREGVEDMVTEGLYLKQKCLEGISSGSFTSVWSTFSNLQQKLSTLNATEPPPIYPNPPSELQTHTSEISQNSYLDLCEVLKRTRPKIEKKKYNRKKQRLEEIEGLSGVKNGKLIFVGEEEEGVRREREMLAQKIYDSMALVRFRYSQVGRLHMWDLMCLIQLLLTSEQYSSCITLFKTYVGKVRRGMAFSQKAIVASHAIDAGRRKGDARSMIEIVEVLKEHETKHGVVDEEKRRVVENLRGKYESDGGEVINPRYYMDAWGVALEGGDVRSLRRIYKGMEGNLRFSNGKFVNPILGMMRETLEEMEERRREEREEERLEKRVWERKTEEYGEGGYGEMELDWTEEDDEDRELMKKIVGVSAEDEGKDGGGEEEEEDEEEDGVDWD